MIKMSAWLIIVYILVTLLVLYILWCYCCVYQSQGKNAHKRARQEIKEAALLQIQQNDTSQTTTATHTFNGTVIPATEVHKTDMPDAVQNVQQTLLATAPALSSFSTQIVSSAVTPSRLNVNQSLQPMEQLRPSPATMNSEAGDTRNSTGTSDTQKCDLPPTISSVLKTLDDFLSYYESTDTHESRNQGGKLTDVITQLKSLESSRDLDLRNCDESLQEVKVVSGLREAREQSGQLLPSASTDGNQNQSTTKKVSSEDSAASQVTQETKEERFRCLFPDVPSEIGWKNFLPLSSDEDLEERHRRLLFEPCPAPVERHRASADQKMKCQI